jgi:hypothetical protein
MAFYSPPIQNEQFEVSWIQQTSKFSSEKSILICRIPTQDFRQCFLLEFSFSLAAQSGPFTLLYVLGVIHGLLAVERN